MAIAWFNGHLRKTSFSIDVSVDGKDWNEVYSGESNGTTKDFESYTFPSASARYVRITGYGNSSNEWNSIIDLELYGLMN